MKYEIKINEFEGPLDLLLHLIKSSDMNIFDINLAVITNQYLDYIEAMEEMNLNVASEYLVMAAELIEIKSSILLPKPVIEEDSYEEDPREALIERLLDYKKYKEVTSSFKELEEKRNQVYTKCPENLKAYTNYDIDTMSNIDLSMLVEALNKFLERKEEEKPLHTTVTTKEYSVKERSREIRSLLHQKKKLSFNELFDIPRKDYVIVTFLSILSMCKKSEIEIKQENNFDDIYLSLRSDD